MTPRAAMAWFLHDMAEVSGYAVREWTEGRALSQYAEHRPMLTAPDPWYYAGAVALESCKIIDLFERDVAEDLMREMLAQMDSVVGRFNDDCSALTLFLMGRLGKGALLLHRKVPDNLLAKIMLILLGSPSTAAPHMPDPGAHKQLKAALADTPLEQAPPTVQEDETLAAAETVPASDPPIAEHSNAMDLAAATTTKPAPEMPSTEPQAAGST